MAFSFYRHIRSCGCSLLIMSSAVLVAGCGQEENNTSAGTNEIQDYIDANPDKVASPEDGPVDEANEFAAGDG